MQNQTQPSFQAGETTNQAIDGILDSALGSSAKEKQVYTEGRRPPVPDPNEADDKNYELRIKKHREERDELAKRLTERDQILANLQGQLETMKKFIKPTESNEPDPTENMTQTEAALYRGIKQLETQLQTLYGNMQGIQTKVVKKEYEAEEGQFYTAYGLETDSQKEEARELVKGFVKDEPEIMQRLLSGQIKVGRVYELALLKSGNPIMKQATQDPSSVFGNGRPEPATPRSESRNANVFEQAKAVLRDKDSTNKKQAVDVGISSIVDDLLNSMMG